MPILYVFENSGNCEKIITILRILNIPYEKVVLDRDKIPDDFVLKITFKKSARFRRQRDCIFRVDVNPFLLGPRYTSNAKESS